MNGHAKKKLTRGQRMRVTEEKIIEGHWTVCMCSCSDEVTNLIDGDRVWTRVEFDCGVVKKINVHCLEEI